MITWTPIADMPDELKDGREVLVSSAEHGALLASWLVDMWVDTIGGNPFRDATHYSEINAP